MRGPHEMQFQPGKPRSSSVLASALTAIAIVLTAAGCSGHLTPLGPDPAATMPQPHRLSSPLILQDMRTQPPAPAGGCLAGYVVLPGGAGPGMCYRKTGTPVTITSAAVSAVSSFRPPPPPGQQAAPIQYGFWITVPAADVPAVAAVIPTASGSPGPPTTSVVTSATPIPAVSVAGRTWVLVGFSTRFAGRELEVFLSSRNQALQLQRMLVVPS
jgi:hypothetical protein